MSGGWLRGRQVIVTAGGTREPIDAVRYLANRSSGKMGNALAAAALDAGAGVTLITTVSPPPSHPGLRVAEVGTADQMLAAVRSSLAGSVMLIMAAAVADYRPAKVVAGKLKKSGAGLTLDLVPTVDILAAIDRDPVRQGVLVVGFAAETEDLVEHARRKLRDKGLDLIVVNDVGVPGIGMGADDNAVTIIDGGGVVAEVSRRPKRDVAEAILDATRKALVRRQAGRFPPNP